MYNTDNNKKINFLYFFKFIFKNDPRYNKYLLFYFVKKRQNLKSIIERNSLKCN